MSDIYTFSDGEIQSHINFTTDEAKSAKSKEAKLKKLQLYKERAETIRKFLADRDIRRHEVFT